MFEGASVVVLGLGISGQAAARYYIRKGSRVVGIDNNPAISDNPLVKDLVDRGMQLRAGPEQTEWLGEGECMIVSPGIMPSHPLVTEAVRRGMPIYTELELGLVHLNKPTIGITGTNGKTTTTTLTAEIMRATGMRVFAGGNMGIPVLEADPDEFDIAVVETSSFQLHYLNDFRFRYGVLLNIAPDHLDWHSTMWQYQRAKFRLFTSQKAEDVAVVNGEEQWCELTEGITPARVLRFGEGPADKYYARLEGEELWIGNEFLMKRSEVPLKGRMNALNVLAAAAVTMAAGAPVDCVREVIAGFVGLPHRLEYVGTVDGREVYDDSKSTTPHSTVAAIDALKNGKPMTLILGGSDKQLSFESVVHKARENCFAVVVTGQTGARIFEAFLVSGSEKPLVVKTRKFKDAVEWAMAVTPPGGLVVLSPACASFDEFKNYAQRGETFRRLIYGRNGN
ncbi:MAG: UDP-N-acetylmuramoyl-L-alanine--D-glutamate ligase [bacterium JZ-2024 1]